jgi:putative nucleotidyltransferase with HDIG domain
VSIDPAVEEQLIGMVERMPAFPVSVQKILSMTTDINCAPKDLVAVIEHDPVLTGKVLKIVNSSYFGLSKPIVSIKHAVVFVGLNTVRHLAMTIAAIGSLPRNNDAGFDMDEYLQHSLCTGAISRILAGRCGVPKRKAADFFVAGLLHDIGQVVLAVYRPEEFRRVLEASYAYPRHVVERSIFGFDHADVGALLVARWNLPADVVKAVEEHNDFERVGGSTAISDCVHVAALIMEQIALHRGVPGEGTIRDRLLESDDLPAVAPTVRERFGGDFRSIVLDLSELDTELNRARAFAL